MSEKPLDQLENYVSRVALLAQDLRDRNAELETKIDKLEAELEELRESIIKGLKNLEHPETTEKIPTKVHLKEEEYSGPYRNNAPDIIFFLNKGEYLVDVQPMDYPFEYPNWKIRL